jgi:hypothetical protein
LRIFSCKVRVKKTTQRVVGGTVKAESVKIVMYHETIGQEKRPGKGGGFLFPG